MTTPRPFYWSIRRELWENRSLYIAPLTIAGVALFANMIRMFRLPQKMRALAALTPDQQRIALFAPFSMTAAVILVVGIIVGMFYCLDALHGERRDRSILFWKSLPVSDRTAVMAKASIPLVVQPVIGMLIVISVQLLMLLSSTTVLLMSGMSPAMLWGNLPLFQSPLVMIYGVTVHALWYAPIYAWLLLVSAWARRVPLLWAVLPFVVINVLERIASGTTYFGELLKYRFMGAMIEAFSTGAAKAPISRFSQLEPLNFLSAPGLWIGLLFAAACLAGAIRLRRNREPI